MLHLVLVDCELQSRRNTSDCVVTGIHLRRTITCPICLYVKVVSLCNDSSTKNDCIHENDIRSMMPTN